MPKVPSDDNGDDISDVDDVAHDGTTIKPDGQPANGAADNESNDSGDDDEEEYAVESITSHKGTGRNLRYEIKWVGYSSDENTFEPVENLLPDARDILTAYIRKIGYDPATSKGKEKTPKSGTSLKRNGSISEDSPAPTKRVRKGEDGGDEGTWLPKSEDWEQHVKLVTHIEKDPETGQLVVFIEWKNGKKTKVSMAQVYQRCPRPMLKFYEQHLKFTTVD